MEKTDLIEILNFIDPRFLSYQEWCDVGMALKHEGRSVDDWDAWSLRDPGRYHAGECEKKWVSFRGAAEPRTAGTIIHLAQMQGWKPAVSSDPGHELGWDDTIVVDTDWIEDREVTEPDSWNPKKELIRYLETLFEPGENVGYVTESFEKETSDGKTKWVPKNNGHYDRTAGQLIEELQKTDDICNVIGDYDPQGGAWIRFNPLDGKYTRNENVTEFRYALVESDNMPIEKQNAIVRELELPIAVLVHSGGKSLHAIVKVDANDYAEYKKRVNYLYDVCQKNGMVIDTQNRNPSRLSRMPGIMRNGHKQHIVDVNIGKASWSEWQEWIEGINDDLPDIENLADFWNDMPELADELISGVLRKGHKMLIAGPSKAGKSFLQIQLAIAIAEGRDWLGWHCAKGRVMYVNLELDRASCLHRFKDAYKAMGLLPKSIGNLEIWNLRGKSVPMDKLAPKLIRRAAKRDFVAVIIDPIYKVITGDENSADQMAAFCNQFDKVCTELGCAVIYCHHHSKGAQGGKKSMDRASGSGVFARDPDALLDMIQLPLDEDQLKTQADKAECEARIQYLTSHMAELPGPDDQLSAVQMKAWCDSHLSDHRRPSWGSDKVLSPREECDAQASEARASAMQRTAWRIEGTLREFPAFAPVNLWFNYPIHYIDGEGGILQDVDPEEVKPLWQRASEARKKKNETKGNKVLSDRILAHSNLVFDNNGKDGIPLKDVMEAWGMSTEKGVRSYVKKGGMQHFYIKEGLLYAKEKSEEGTGNGRN